MSNDDKNITLGEAAACYLAQLAAAKREKSQPEVSNFVRFYGSARAMTGLAAHEVEKYAERATLSDTGYLKKLEIVRAFLACARKAGWTRTNLGVHLKTKKSRGVAAGKAGSAEAIPLTEEGYAGLKAEIESLKEQRPQLIEEIRRAAADKDFRENAPLEAAREQHGQLMGRIKELEEAMKSAVVIDEKQETTFKISIGHSVTLCDLDSGEELCYRLVSPREVDPTRGKISNTSPIGQALIGKGRGEVVVVVAPVGKLRYQIKQVER